MQRKRAMNMTEPSRQILSSHVIHLDNRQNLHITGVSDIYSFDDRFISLSTTSGALSIEGENLHISNLTLECGEVDVSGIITGIFYLDEKGKEKGRLFRKNRGFS